MQKEFEVTQTGQMDNIGRLKTKIKYKQHFKGCDFFYCEPFIGLGQFFISYKKDPESASSPAALGPEDWVMIGQVGLAIKNP